MGKVTNWKTTLAATAVCTLLAGVVQAATVSPTVGGGGFTWDFGTLSGDNDSDTAIDVATDLPKFIDFFALPTTGTLAIEINNSSSETKVMSASQLLCLSGCTDGVYTLSYGGTDLYTVESGAGQSLGSFSVASGSSLDLVWSWDVPSTGQVSTNLAAAVPVPAAGFLLLGGLGGLAALKRRKKA
jgi:hypothetical protein